MIHEQFPVLSNGSSLTADFYGCVCYILRICSSFAQSSQSILSRINVIC